MTKLVSLIVCTIGRSTKLARLLTSLNAQTRTSFELIVVDQSDSDEIEAALRSQGAGYAICHVRSARGLSRARNVGLRYARGDVVGFPDDDCWYDKGVIEHVARFFKRPECAVLTGRTVDRDGIESVSAHRAESGFVNRHNVFESGNSSTLFARSAAIRDIGGFDETLGVGAATPFQSGEETDLLLRLMRKGYTLCYDRAFTVHHDQTDDSPEVTLARIRAYSPGYGRVLRIHHYGPGYLAKRVSRAALRGAVCLVTGDQQGARQRYGWAMGSLRGFLAQPTAAHQSNRPDRAGERSSETQGGNTSAHN